MNDTNRVLPYARCWKVMRIINDALFSASIPDSFAKSMLEHQMDFRTTSSGICYMRYYPNTVMQSIRMPMFVFASHLLAEDYVKDHREGGHVKFAIAKCDCTKVQRVETPFSEHESWVMGLLPSGTVFAQTLIFEEAKPYEQ